MQKIKTYAFIFLLGALAASGIWLWFVTRTDGGDPARISAEIREQSEQIRTGIESLESELGESAKRSENVTSGIGSAIERLESVRDSGTELQDISREYDELNREFKRFIETYRAENEDL